MQFFLVINDVVCLSTGLENDSALSSVASPICQEGQSERIFPICPLFPNFSLFFPVFCPIFDEVFDVEGGTLSPLTPLWLRHWVRTGHVLGGSPPKKSPQNASKIQTTIFFF